MTRSWTPHYHGLEVCSKKEDCDTTSQAPHCHGPRVYNNGKKKRPWWRRGVKLLIVVALGCGKKMNAMSSSSLWPWGVQQWKKEDSNDKRGVQLLVATTLGCAAAENKKPRRHNEKKTQKGAYLVAPLFFTPCSMQMKLHPSSKLLPLFLFTRVKLCSGGC